MWANSATVFNYGWLANSSTYKLLASCVVLCALLIKLSVWLIPIANEVVKYSESAASDQNKIKDAMAHPALYDKIENEYFILLDH